MDLIKVSSKAHSTNVAGAIAGVIRSRWECQVQAIGAGAVNQAIKAVAIARSYLKEDGLDLAVVPTFCDVEINGEERTAVRLYVESRAIADAPRIPFRHGDPVGAEP